MKIVIERTSLQMGEKMPRGYGFGKVRYDMDIRYYYIIPINFIIRLWQRIIHYYYKIMFPGKENANEHAAYMKGYAKGLDMGAKRTLNIVESRLNKLLEERKKKNAV